MGQGSWTKNDEDFLKKMEVQCDVYYKHNIGDYKYYHTLASKFNIPILVLSALNSLCAVVLNQFIDQKYVSIVNAVVSAGTGVLGSVQLYMKINEKLSNSLRSSILFKRLGMKISKELSIEAVERGTEGQTFVSECFSDFNTALEQGNPVERSKLPNFMLLKSSIDDDDTVSTTTSPRLRNITDSLLQLARKPIILRNSDGTESPNSDATV